MDGMGGVREWMEIEKKNSIKILPLKNDIGNSKISMEQQLM